MSHSEFVRQSLNEIFRSSATQSKFHAHRSLLNEQGDKFKLAFRTLKFENRSTTGRATGRQAFVTFFDVVIVMTCKKPDGERFWCFCVGLPLWDSVRNWLQNYWPTLAVMASRHFGIRNSWRKRRLTWTGLPWFCLRTVLYMFHKQLVNSSVSMTLQCTNNYRCFVQLMETYITTEICASRTRRKI